MKTFLSLVGQEEAYYKPQNFTLNWEENKNWFVENFNAVKNNRQRVKSPLKCVKVRRVYQN